MTKKIEIVTNHYDKTAAGVYTVVKAHAEFLSRCHDVSISSCSSDNGNEGRNFIQFGSKSFCFSPSFFLYSLTSRSKIIHFHGFWSFLLLSILFSSLFWPGRKIFISPHGMLDDFALLKNKHFKILFIKCINLFISDRVTFHALTRQEQSCIKSYFPNNFCTVIPNAIKIHENFHVRRTVKYVFLGRLTSKKNIDLMIEAFYEFREQSGVDVELDIFGYFEDAVYRNKIFDILAKGSGVNYKGELAEGDKFQTLGQYSHILLFSSSEGLPMSLLEGMSVGCIPICTRECNLAEEINTIGYVSICAFDDFVKALIDSVHTFNSKRLNALKIYLDNNYSPEVVFRKIQKMYQ